MLGLADDTDRRAAIFTGPVLTEGDPQLVNQPGENLIQIPAGFWKVMAVRVGNTLRAAGFLVWQRDFDKPEPEVFTPFLEQVRITTLEYLTSLSFGALAGVDPLQFGTMPAAPALPPIEAPAQPIGAPPPMAVPRQAMITSPGDIFLD